MKMTIQEFIPGQLATTMFACWRGEVLASSTVEVLVSQGPTGAANVVQVLKNNEIEDAIRALAWKLQLSGFHGLDFVLEQDTGAAYLIELNPRATQLGHLNLSAHGDLAGVMARKLRNEAPDRMASENQIQNCTIAFYPYAFNSNPGSAYLHQGYHDVPWDEPALVRELMCDPGRRLWLRWWLRTFSAGNQRARGYKPRLSANRQHQRHAGGVPLAVEPDH